MSMHQSIEAGCLESVIEDNLDAVRERLQKFMLDGELIEFYEHVSTLLDLIFEETSRRRARGTVDGIRPHLPMSQENLDLQRRMCENLTPDTGEINIIRGTG